MCTSREGKALLRDNLSDAYDCVILQFGIADAYTTIKYAPYISYYPDNPLRKAVRNVVKKYKKLCRNYGLHDRFGETNIISETEYRANYQYMIELCGDRQVVLPETIPHLDTFRNPHIKRYNAAIEALSAAYANCHVIEIFDDFLAQPAALYQDKGHPNDAGYAHITRVFADYFGLES
jgi:lysophospholipase L1-like esterase